ncbi:MAG: Re/Si-specific NAD(P)(+) transhydrogenase subunit alpha [Dehalococcoidia bacterium]
MIIGVPAESDRTDRRVAIVPAVISALQRTGAEVLVEPGAGAGAGFSDEAYEQADAKVAEGREHVFSSSDILVRVHGLGRDGDDLAALRENQVLIGLLNPLGKPEGATALAEKGVTSFALELLPRISRAQSMDALTSMATVAGYKAVLLAAGTVNKMYPLLMTAAGTVTPARVFVLGAGVAGLQAIATANRLGAVVQAYDIRPAVKEQVESLGARFVELPLEAENAEDSGGYAQAMDEDFYRRQRELIADVVSQSDVVISTALVPGRPAPLLVTEEAVHRMRPGAIIVDLAAETGGNCALTAPGETIEVNGVTIAGPTELAASIPGDASSMYARNITAFLGGLVKDGEIDINLEDEVLRGTLLTRGGEVVNERIRELLGSPQASAAGTDSEQE